MRALGFKLQSQTVVVENGKTCDRMKATDENGASATRYFRVDLS